MKKIAIIPPSALKVKEQDLFIKRIAKYCQKNGIQLYIILMEKVTEQDSSHKYIYIRKIDDIVKINKKHSFDIIIHRCWMHHYDFASKLIGKCNNLAFYIKDWMDEIPKKKYKYIYKTEEDYNGIKKIFNSNHKILSHYTKEYTDKLRKRYSLEKDNFIFFPEFCNKDDFVKRKNINLDKIKLVYAGSFDPTSYPHEINEGKLFFNTFKILTKQKIHVDILTLPKSLKRMEENPVSFSDWIYENKYNKYFNIKLGKELDTSILQKYHFGLLFELEYLNDNLALKSARHSIVSKFAYYLEAGIPIIINKKWTALNNLVEKYKIGISVSEKDIYKIKNKINISKSEYLDLVNNIYSFRDEFSYDKINIDKLLNLE